MKHINLKRFDILFDTRIINEVSKGFVNEISYDVLIFNVVDKYNLSFDLC